MKKIFFSALIAVSVATSAFATDTNVSTFARNSFQTEFSGATNVAWSSIGDYAQVSFTLDGKTNVAFFRPDGSIVAVTNIITADQLPVKAKRVLAKEYCGYLLKEALRFENDDEVAYFISAETDKEAVILKISETGSISTFRKTTK